MKKIFYEYILAMIGNDMYYFEVKDNNQYLDDIFDWIFDTLTNLIIVS